MLSRVKMRRKIKRWDGIKKGKSKKGGKKSGKKGKQRKGHKQKNFEKKNEREKKMKEKKSGTEKEGKPFYFFLPFPFCFPFIAFTLFWTEKTA